MSGSDAILALIDTVTLLRSEKGCPWDREQTMETLTPCIIEECHELVEAIESGNTSHIIEECGDVLLQIVMIATIATETQLFSLTDIATRINNKMIQRHPHVFSTQSLDNSAAVIEQWETIKQSEQQHTHTMDSVPALPALIQAEKIQKKAAKTGFDWPSSTGALNKVHEEIEEFNNSLSSMNLKEKTMEAGDLLFSLVNLLRHHDINPEEALRQSNKKFMNRFTYMEKQDPLFSSRSLAEKERLWQRAKTPFA